MWQRERDVTIIIENFSDINFNGTSVSNFPMSSMRQHKKKSWEKSGQTRSSSARVVTIQLQLLAVGGKRRKEIRKKNPISSGKQKNEREAGSHANKIYI